MRNQIVAVYLLGILLTTGCGSNGRDGRDGTHGDVYIAYSWMYSPFYYSSTDPGIPAPGLINNQYYLTSPGTYTYTYRSWDDSIWTGTYSLSANSGEKGTKGEKGGFFFQKGADGKNGADGADNYYQLYCPSYGATLYKWTYSHYSSMRLKAELQNKIERETNIRGEAPLSIEMRNQFKGLRLE
ncbi:hypothetical protein K8S19_06315 [bacterium]|nr:hypothetical protein [bacterium]